MFKKHPKALPFLFFSEMWERFGYYLMIGIFTLYLKDQVDGFNFDEKDASNLYGTFIALVFFTPFIGGLVADRILGYRKSIISGGILMGIGYCLMGIHNINMLYFSMFLVIVGNGFFKPNISTLLGNVYSTEKHSHQKDEGYNIFYMGINIGAFVCNFFGAALYTTIGWGAAFIAAGIGMFIGVIIFIIGTKHYKAFDVVKPLQPGDMSTGKILAVVLLPSLVAGIVGWFIPGQLLDSDSTDAFIFACVPVLIYYASIYFKSNEEEKPGIYSMLVIFLVVILFWAVFKQNGSALNTWADKYTNRKVTGTQEQVFAALKQTKTIEYKKDSITLTTNQFKKVKEKVLVKGKEISKEVKTFAAPDYFKNDTENYSENQKIKVWSTNLSQSINPGWVIALTPLVVAFFAFLRRKGKEPTLASKIAFGLLISALSVLVMVAAVKTGNNGAEKTSIWWLIGSYGVVTIGELFLSPMGLSLVSKLSPARITSLMMGGWFLATSIGNKLSGILASQWDGYENKANYFWVNFLLLLFATALMFLLLKKLNRVFKIKK